MITCGVVSRKDGSYHVYTADDDDDDDGLDRIDGRCCTHMDDDIGVFNSMHAPTILQSQMKDGYHGNYLEYNDV